jgi:hypothetical protein
MSEGKDPAQMRALFAGQIAPAIYWGGVTRNKDEAYRDAVIREAIEFADLLLAELSKKQI